MCAAWQACLNASPRLALHPSGRRAPASCASMRAPLGHAGARRGVPRHAPPPPPPPPHTPRTPPSRSAATVCSALDEDGSAAADVTVFEWDVIQYKLRLPSESALFRLGRVVSVADGTCTVEPMAEQSAGVWVLDGDFEEPETISLSSVSQVVEADYGQRAIEDRVSNPHGEHAEEVWEIQQAVDAIVCRGQAQRHA